MKAVNLPPFLPPSPAFTHLLGIGDVTGVGQDKGAELVKILNCPPPLVGGRESLQQSVPWVQQTDRSDMALTQTPSQYGHGANGKSRRRENKIK